LQQFSAAQSGFARRLGPRAEPTDQEFLLVYAPGDSLSLNRRKSNMHEQQWQVASGMWQEGAGEIFDFRFAILDLRSEIKRFLILDLRFWI
jgi:hypothetical protein